MKIMAVVTTGDREIVFPKNPSVGDYFTCVQNWNTTSWIYDGCKWLMFADHSGKTIFEDHVESYDRSMEVV